MFVRMRRFKQERTHYGEGPTWPKACLIAGGRTQKQTDRRQTDGQTNKPSQRETKREREKERERGKGGRSTVKCTSSIQQTWGWGEGRVQAPTDKKWAPTEAGSRQTDRTQSQCFSASTQSSVDSRHFRFFSLASSSASCAAPRGAWCRTRGPECSTI